MTTDPMLILPKKKKTPEISLRQSKKAETFKKIIQIGAELFVDPDIEEFSLRSLARKLEMNPNNIYNYVESKRELWLVIRAEFFREFAEYLAQIQTQPHKNTLELLMALCEATLEYYNRDYRKFHMMNLTVAPHSDKVGPIEETYKPFRLLNKITEIIDLAITTGECQPVNASMLTYSIWAELEGAILIEWDLRIRHEKSEIGIPAFSYTQFREFTLESIRYKLNNYFTEEIPSK